VTRRCQRTPTASSARPDWRKRAASSKAEEERRRHERQVRLEKARVDHLLGQAQALHQAGDIRDYVQRIRALNAHAPDPMTPEELECWSDWALTKADRIDPVVSGAYKPRSPEDS